jgi:hypothetical protein
MNGQFKQKTTNDNARVRAISLSAAFLLVTVSVSGIGAGVALALDSGTAKAPAAPAGQTISLSSPSSPAMADPCLPLLKKVRQPSDQAIYRNRRPADNHQTVPAVAIGYVLGLRHAPGPKEYLKDDISRGSLPSSQASITQSRALATADYRRCRSELELRSLGQG